MAEARRSLDELQGTLRGLTSTLARAWARVTHERLHEAAGFETLAACAEQVLGMSRRTAQRLAKQGWQAEWYPEVDAAIRVGAAPSRLLDIVDETNETDWLAIAARVGKRELLRAVADATEARTSRPTIERYKKAIEIVDRATSAGGAKVALRHPKPVKFSGSPLRGHPDLLKASQWLLDTVVVPPAKGFKAVKALSDDRCTNPECGCRSMRVEAHHIHERARGGGDELSNGTGACRMCHVRGLHAGRLSVEAIEVEGHDVLRWSWPDGRQVLYFRDEPGRPSVQ